MSQISVTRLMDTYKDKNFGSRLKRDLKRNWSLYILALPMVAFFLVFHYAPLYGLLIAFKDFSPALGIMGSPWVGFDNFLTFFNSRSFTNVVRNTFMLNFYALIFTMPASIIFALLLNEIRTSGLKRSIQTLSYLPFFVSLVVVCGMILEFTGRNGIINDVVYFFTGDRIQFMLDPGWFRTVYTVSDIWQLLGWGAIIYIAAIAGLDQELYEAATIDGAGRWRKMRYITLPGILSIIVIIYILRIGQMLSLGFEKIILLYNPMIYETADVISSFMFRVGLMQMEFSYSAAVGMFNSMINFSLLLIANQVSRRLLGSSLW